MKAPRNNIMRAAPFELSESDGRTLEGYAAVFDTPTRIDSWEGKFDEQIARGAFRSSLHNATPVLQFDHGRDPATGTLPIGAIESIREDDHGLYVKARMFENPRAEAIREAIAAGAVDGMSFRFRVEHDRWDESRDVPARTITEATVFEVGPVVFPAYAATSVGVRAELGRLDDEQRVRLLNDLLAGLRGETDRTPTLDATGDGAPTINERSRILREIELKGLGL